MTSPIITGQSASSLIDRPEIRPGYTVRVHEKIQEGAKERVQIFEGLVISVHKGLAPTDSTFTVRRIVSGVGVERVFSLHSPVIVKIEVKKVAKVRRAKLFFLRGRQGKAARLSERFTTAEEFAIAAKVEEKKEEEKVLEDKTEEQGEEGTEEKEEITEEKSEISEDLVASKPQPQPEPKPETEEKKEE
ncbi:MAG: 50S ribosomal protein L19 [Kiritimatiellales bacterium]|nr:50S ribosomal protein L19 [Kiritimatiellales bacterium]